MMKPNIQASRRHFLAGTALAAGATVLAATTTMAIAEATPAAAPVPPADLASLPHERVELVTPPFTHAHEQATTAGPKVMEFTMTIEEKSLVIDADGTT